MSNRLYSSNDEDTNIFLAFVKLAGILVLGAVGVCLLWLYSAFAFGYVGMTLWEWFIVPVFGLPLLSWGKAYGIALLVGLWTHQHRVNTNKDERTTPEKVGQAIGVLLSPWIVLFVGWVGKTYFL